MKVLPVLPGTRIRIFAIGEMFQDGNWTEIHREPLAAVQPYDIYMDRAKQRRRRPAPPASPAPSPPPAPLRRRRVQLRAPPEGEESRPQPSAPHAMRARTPSPPCPQGASPYHRCAPSLTGPTAKRGLSWLSASGATRGSAILP